MKILVYFIIGFMAGTVAWLLKHLLLSLSDAWGASALFRASTTRHQARRPPRPYHRIWRAP